MKESVQAAQSFVHLKYGKVRDIAKRFEKNDIHVHIPEDYTPKDGPSAGIAMFTSIVLTLQGIIDDDIAMTGEITLRGKNSSTWAV